jgi:hypothetical protein
MNWYRGRHLSLKPVLLLIVFATSVFFVSSVGSAVASTGSQMAFLPVLDQLDRAENPLSNGGQWTALGWALGKEEEEKEEVGHRSGKDTTTGWTPADASPTINGAFFNAAKYNGGTQGDAVSVTMNANPGSGKYVALWLNMHDPEFRLRKGYRLKWLENSESGSFTVTLSKWVSNTETVLAKNTSVKMSAGTQIALSEAGGRIVAWKGTASGGVLTSFLSANDTSYFATGYVGIEGTGTTSRSLNFRAGNFQSAPNEAANVPLLDNLTRSESPLSNGKKWEPLHWVAGGSTGVDTTTGWQAPGFPTVGGAYWTPETFVDIGANQGFGEVQGGGDAVSLTMNLKPGTAERYLSLWLDMPNPGVEETGYQLKMTETSTAGTFTVTLSKWSAGVNTVLSTVKSAIPAGTRITLGDVGGVVFAWTGSGDEYNVLTAEGDSTFSGGYAGIEGSGSVARATNFQAGTLPAYPSRLQVSPLPAQPIIDFFQVPCCENPVPLSAQWSKTAWAQAQGVVGYTSPYSGWQASSARLSGQVHGAYWNSSTFSDAGLGDAVSGVLGILPVASEYQSLLINMPTPGTTDSGYELRWTGETTGGGDKVELARLASGVRTVVASKEHVALTGGTTLVLSEKGGSLAAWMLSPGEDHFTLLLSANTARLGSAYASGFVGMETGGSGVAPFAKSNFGHYGASSLNPPEH